MTPARIRIDLRRGLRALVFTLVLPMSVAIGVDWLAGSQPWLTIAAMLICIPLATIVVTRTILAEFERVVALVAPPTTTTMGQEGTGETLAGRQEQTDDGGAADLTPTDWPLDGQPFTEGAQRHHG